MKKYILISFFTSSLFAMDNTDIHYKTYKERFPQTRKSYKKYSNEEILFLNHVEKQVQDFKEKYSHIFANTVKVFAIGCHDGDVSKKAISIIQQYNPKKISFHAIDPYYQHINETTEKLKTLNIDDLFVEQCNDFDSYKPTEENKNSAHIILVEQICHHVKNLEQLIKTITDIASEQAIIIFGHTDDSASTVNTLFSKFIGGDSYITPGICPKIKTILTKNNYTFTKTKKTQKLKLPKPTKATWKTLDSVNKDYNKNKYEEYSQEDLDIKNVIEFCATQPLEKLAHSWFKKKAFLLALWTKLGSTIELIYKIYTVHITKDK